VCKRLTLIGVDTSPTTEKDMFCPGIGGYGDMSTDLRMTASSTGPVVMIVYPLSTEKL
jgi:hypothetical protein